MTARRRWIAAGVAVAVAAAGLGAWAVLRTGGGSRDAGPRPGVSGPGGSGPGGSGPGPGSAQVPGGPPSTGLGPTSPSGSRPVAGWWRPSAGLTWQWQLSGGLDRSVDAQVYDVDGAGTSAADVAALHAAGRRVICYVNAGAHEKWRPDAGQYPGGLLGRELEGWPDERWLDVRRWDVLEPILTARFAQCRAKGFDAVEPDNLDGYANGSGFTLSADDQLQFNRRLADLAHRLGLAIGLKNDVAQAGALEPGFDFAVNEQCMRYDECERLRPFVAAGKPVFHVEYSVEPGSFCGKARALGFSSMRKRRELDAWRQPC